MPAIPEPITRYLGWRSTNNRYMAYIRLCRDNCVDLVGGDLWACGIGTIGISIPVDEQVHSLVGLLPAQDQPLFISNAQIKKNLFVDLHIFLDMGKQWVVLFDNTLAALELQGEQQERLSNDIVFEK